MFADSRNYLRMLKLKPSAEQASIWHLWTVFIPRRSITGRLVRGQVWRRRDGRRWIYNQFAKYR